MESICNHSERDMVGTGTAPSRTAATFFSPDILIHWAFAKLASGARCYGPQSWAKCGLERRASKAKMLHYIFGATIRCLRQMKGRQKFSADDEKNNQCRIHWRWIPDRVSSVKRVTFFFELHCSKLWDRSIRCRFTT